MAYDRYDRGGGYRDEDRGVNRSMKNDRDRGGDNRGGDNRGFWDRARDEVQSWFGDEDSGGRRDRDDRNERGAMFGGGRDHERDRDRSSSYGGGQSSSYGRGRDAGDYRNQYGRGGGESGGFGGGDYARQERSPWGSTNHSGDDDRSERGSGRGYPSGYGQRGGGSYSPSSQGQQGWDRGQDHDRQGGGRQSQGGDRYQPMTGDYGRGGSGGRSGMGGQDFSQEQYGRQDRSQDQRNDRPSGGMFGGRDDHDDDRSRNRGGFVGAAAGAGASMLGRGGNSPHDEHYSSWRQRQIDELDNDYHAYRQEHQSRFENEFTGFRQQRQTKRQMLQAIREHFEVVDQNGEHIGTVDKVRGDHVILTKNDLEANGMHRSFSCQLLDKVEGNKVTLNGTKDSLRNQLHEERGQDDRGSGGGFLGGLFGGDRDNNGRDDRPRENSMSGATGSTGAATMTGSSGSTASSQSGSTDEGPHILDRSFSGTYNDDSNKKA